MKISELNPNASLISGGSPILSELMSDSVVKFSPGDKVRFAGVFCEWKAFDPARRTIELITIKGGSMVVPESMFLATVERLTPADQALLAAEIKEVLLNARQPFKKKVFPVDKPF